MQQMYFECPLDAEGRITIPEQVRQKFDLRTGDVLCFLSAKKQLLFAPHRKNENK